MPLRISESFHFQPGTFPDRATTAAPEFELWQDWDVLAEETGAPPFLRPGWFGAWHRAYGRGELRVLTVRENKRLTGVLPVELRGRATLSATNTHSPLFGPVAESADAARALAAKLVGESEGRIELCYVDPAAPLVDALRSADRRLLVETVLRSPYVALDGPDEDSYPANLPRRFAKDLRRRRRRLEEQGRVDVAVHSTVEGLDAALDEFVALESSGWKAEEGTAIASREASPRFYAEIAGWAAQRGWLRLTFLRLDGRAIAAEFDLACAGALYALKSGFDPEYRGFAPGHLLTRECLDAARAAGLSSYEFLGTDEPYKMSWTQATRERVRVQAFPRTLSGRAAITRARLRPVVRRLRGR